MKNWREDEIQSQILYVLGAIFIESIVFHYGLKLRASIGRLPDEDLSEFLIETLFKGGLKTGASVLFVLSRATKCAIEQSTDKCFSNIRCAAVYIHLPRISMDY